MSKTIPLRFSDIILSQTVGNFKQFLRTYIIRYYLITTIDAIQQILFNHLQL